MRLSDWSSDVCSSDLSQASRQDLVRQARLGDAGRVVMGQDQRRRVMRQRSLDHLARVHAGNVEGTMEKIGRASCRERVCQYVSISVVAVKLKKKDKKKLNNVTIAMS